MTTQAEINDMRRKLDRLEKDLDDDLEGVAQGFSFDELTGQWTLSDVRDGETVV